MQMRSILGISSAAVFGYQPRKENLSEAIMNFRQGRFVGLTEDFQASIRLCNTCLHTRLMSKGAHNVVPPSLILEVIEMYGDMIREMIRVDEQFYAAGVEYFNDLSGEVGLPFTHDQEIERINLKAKR